jgi:histidinol-phosphate aminotransferase
MTSRTPLHLQYGVNAFADDIYTAYQPLQNTAHYPDPFCTELRQALARYTGMSDDKILVASGSDELIDIYIRLHKARIPKLKVAYSPPTYPQYDAYTAREQVERILLPHERATINADLVKKMGGDPKTTVIMLDSPANPSGEIMTAEQFVGLLEAGYQVFADEAYYEFYGHTMADYIDTYPEQLVVSRSFSKFAAMAGSRVGYLLADPKVITEFRKWQLFFSVHSESQRRALYALEHADDFHAAIKKMSQTKEKVDTAIRGLGAYEVLPSLSMYTIFKHHTVPTEQLHQKLQVEHNIHTTRFPGFKGHDVIRSAILPLPRMKRLITALASYV